MMNDQKTVVRITTRIFPDPSGGGPSKHAYYLSKYASGNGIKIINISCQPNDKKKGIEKITSDFEIHYLPFFAIDIFNHNLFSQIKFTFRFIIYCLKELFSINLKEKISLIHCHHPPLNGIPALVFKILFRIPYIYTYHGVEFRNFFEKFIGFKLIHNNASLIIAISEKIKNIFSKSNFVRKIPILVMPNGIEVIESPKPIKQKIDFLDHLPENAILITYIGYMNFEQKVRGMIDFLTAFQNFLGQLEPNIRQQYFLVFVGNGPFKKMLESALEAMPFSKQVLLLGQRDDVPSIIFNSRLTALTSYVEGFPNVILESMVAHIPCIATDVGDVKRLIGDSGFLVKPGDVKAMQLALNQFFSDHLLEKKLKEKAYNQIITNFTWKKISLKVHRLYQKIHK